METSGRSYPEILKYGSVLHMLRLKSKVATLLWSNESLKINSTFEINPGLVKLTLEKMIIPTGGISGRVSWQSAKW